jgi:hypothetical protein
MKLFLCMCVLLNIFFEYLVWNKIRCPYDCLSLNLVVSVD